MITRAQFLKILPYARARVDEFLGPLNAAMEEYEINTPARQAAFIAQLGHESAQFLYMEELASGAAYDGRVDLGNTRPEAIAIAKKNGTTPGRFFKGHGPIQITGFDNHLAAMMALEIDCVERPKLLCEPLNGCRAAGWFWHTHGLNALADVGNFKRTTKIINGGYNGHEERVALYRVALPALGSLLANTPGSIIV